MKALKNNSEMYYHILADDPIKCNFLSTKRRCKLRFQSVKRESNSSFGSIKLGFFLDMV